MTAGLRYDTETGTHPVCAEAGQGPNPAIGQAQVLRERGLLLRLLCLLLLQVVLEDAGRLNTVCSNLGITIKTLIVVTFVSTLVPVVIAVNSYDDSTQRSLMLHNEWCVAL